MASTLTLNKITSQRGISVGEAAKKIADLGWNPSYVQEAMTYPTDYKITKQPKDPMKQTFMFFEMVSGHMDAITGPVVFNIWARIPARLDGEDGTAGELWFIVDEWLLENNTGPVNQQVTWSAAYDYYYIQRKSGTDALKAFLGYEPDQGLS